MNLRLPLESLAARFVAFGIMAGLCGVLAHIVVCNFLVGALSDERIGLNPEAPPASFITAPFTEERDGINPGTLVAASRYLSNSPRLHMRVADFKRYDVADDSLAIAESHAKMAAALSPHDYRPLLLLASIQDSRNNPGAAEASVRDALQLASSSIDAHWQLAVLLLRNGRFEESFKEFRTAGSGPASYSKAAMDLIWTEYAEDAAAASAVTPEDADHRLALAHFLLEKSLPMESADVFRRIGHEALMGNPETPQYLNNLIDSGNLMVAYELWRVLLDRRSQTVDREAAKIVWNGGFESDILVDFAQFDWAIRQSKYARISIDSNTAHSGTRSLRVDFIGRDTTRLADEVKQLTFVRPGLKYALRYHMKTKDLIVPEEGPRVVLYEGSSGKYIASSEPAASGSSDWREMTLDFSSSHAALSVAIEQWAAYSYEDPSHGTVWFDDFEIVEQN